MEYKLTKSQYKIYKDIFENSSNVIVTGPGGVGKSFLIKCIYTSCFLKKINCGLTATTGIAAYNIQGSTLHRFFGLGIEKLNWVKLHNRIYLNYKIKTKIIALNMLIIDEVSMLGKKLFDNLDKALRKIRKCDKPWGGIQLILCGDFLQLPPVKDTYIFNSENFHEYNFKKYDLTESIRHDDINYFEMLLRIRKGEPTFADLKKIKEKEEQYKEWLLQENTEDTVKPTNFMSTNKEVDEYNLKQLKNLPYEEITFRSHDSYKPYGNEVNQDFYKKTMDDCISQVITLKKGAQVMLKANLDTEGGLCNGSRGVIIELNKHFAKVKFVNGMIQDIGLHIWVYEDDKGKYQRTQIPLVLAWAMTIHKSQGCTLDYAVGELGNNIFCPGQAYVLLSRVRNFNGLFIKNFVRKSIFADKEALEFYENFI